jgi:hypothetical protein
MLRGPMPGRVTDGTGRPPALLIGKGRMIAINGGLNDQLNCLIDFSGKAGFDTVRTAS